MSDSERITVLRDRLRELRSSIVRSDQRPWREVAILAVENELTELGRRLVNGEHLRAVRRRAAC